MAADITVRSGDTLPVVSATLTGPGVNLSTPGVGVVFQWVDDQGVVQSRVGQITNANAGGVQYAWAPGDTDITPGTYNALWIVKYSDGTSVSVPNDHFYSLLVTPRLGS